MIKVLLTICIINTGCVTFGSHDTFPTMEACKAKTHELKANTKQMALQTASILGVKVGTEFEYKWASTCVGKEAPQA